MIPDQIYFISVHPNYLGWLSAPGSGPYTQEFLVRLFTFRLDRLRKKWLSFCHIWTSLD